MHLIDRETPHAEAVKHDSNNAYVRGSLYMGALFTEFYSISHASFGPTLAKYSLKLLTGFFIKIIPIVENDMFW